MGQCCSGCYEKQGAVEAVMWLLLEFRNDGLIGIQCDHGEWREKIQLRHGFWLGVL